MGVFRVVVTDDRFGSYEEEKSVLDSIGCSIEVCNLANGQEAVAKLQDAEGILVNMFPMTADVIRSLLACRVLSRYGVGYDNIDVAAATAKGIWVTRVPDYGFEEVSDHALAMLLALARNLPQVDQRVREGGWNLKNEYRNHRIRGCVLGIVGFGLIGRTLCRKVTGLGLARVLVYDPYLDGKVISRCGAEAVDLSTLLAAADFVSLHVPLSAETKALIGKEEFRRMKPNAILVNTSRGPVVNERDLVWALENGTIGGAGLDVYENEPLAPDSRLKSFPRVILTDHTAYYSEEAVVELKRKAAENVAEVLTGGTPRYPVNRPELPA
jgi:D-3-phosphoglycerate dehydrogenase